MIVPSITRGTALVTLLPFFILALYFRKQKRGKYMDGSRAAASLDKLQGPPSASWLTGNMFEYARKKDPHAEHMNLIRKFGLAYKIKSHFNRDVLYLADPKGLQYVLNTSGYNFHGRQEARAIRVLLGKSILGVEGEEHAQQRRMLLPSFSHSHIHEVVPVFMQVTSTLTEQWKSMIASTQDKGIDINIYQWIYNLTLDCFGQGFLSHDFGALSNKPTKYTEAIDGLFVDMFKNRSNIQLIADYALGRVPEFIGRFLLHFAFSEMNRFQRFLMASSEICGAIIKREKEAISIGKPPSKGLLNTLVRANMDSNAKVKLTDTELMSQMHSFTISGQNTTSYQLLWIFYELARHPESQAKIREEIKSIKEAKGIQELGPSELESLQYATAVIKETLRFHPIGFGVTRYAARDDIIPLACPIKDASGNEVHDVYIKEGQQVFISLVGYNFIKDLWGNDADEWIPERFLNEGEAERSKRTLGVYAHIATFSSGVHACMGWRFAILQMLSAVAGLVEHFEFTLTSSNPTIVKRVSTSVYPCVEGEPEDKPHMPLFIKPIS